MDLQLDLKNAMLLFSYKLEPASHIEILKALILLVSLADSFDFKEIISQITSKYSLIEKLLKDCTSLTFEKNISSNLDIEDWQPKVVCNPEILPAATACNA